jgi:uncharacterized BrkB/YihY/UPF0761 family membrane protein
MTTLVAATAVVIAAFWLRMRHYRRQFNRAMEAMERGGTAQRAARAFWRLVLFVLVIAALWTYVEAHTR